MLILLLVLLSSLLVLPSSLSSTTCSDPLQCLLQYYTINISKIIIPVDDTSSIEIDDFICNSFSLSSLSSQYKVLIFLLLLILLLILLSYY